MSIQFFSPDDIRPHLNIERLIEPVRQAFIAFSQGKADAPIYVLHPTVQSDIHVKSATIEGYPFFTVKMAGWSQVLSQKRDSPSSGIIVVFNSQTCQPVAILQDDHLISDFRTAAAGALASQYLSRPDSETVTVVGTGTQARLQALAVTRVRSIKKLILWGRTSAKAEGLAHQLSEQLPGVSVTAYQNLEAAVRCADIVIVATTAREPIILGDWLQEGQHITSVGSDDANKCELHLSCLSRADALIVDSLEAAKRYGNLHQALQRAVSMADFSVTELGTILSSKNSYRQNNTDVTIASFVGLGVQDLAAVSALSDVILF